MVPAFVALGLYAVVFLTVVTVRGRSLRAIAKAGGDSVPGEPTGAILAGEMLASQGLEAVQVVAADVDAYRAVTRELQLRGDHARGATPAAWAIAAHEVAHAAQHRSGDVNWARWWVLSGHSVWAGVALPVFLLAALVSNSFIAWLLALPCAVILLASGVLSWRTERTATAHAAELLEQALGRTRAATAEPVLRHTGRAYVVESIIDTGLLDRFVDPYRDDVFVGGPGSA